MVNLRADNMKTVMRYGSNRDPMPLWSKLLQYLSALGIALKV